MPVQVGRLTVRATRSGLGQDVVARLRAESLLAALDLDRESGGPPDRSVLVVRRTSWVTGRDMSEQARQSVAALRRRAVRPALEEPTADAEAVLFLDEAELLRCLTQDAVRDRLANWYWQRMVQRPQTRIGVTLATAWIERARWLPAALAGLAQSEAARAVSTLSPLELELVQAAVSAEFQLPQSVQTQSKEADETGESPLSPVGSSELPTDDERPPWASRLTPEINLSRPHEAWLATMIALHRQPGQLRHGDFLVRTQRWLAHDRLAAPAGIDEAVVPRALISPVQEHRRSPAVQALTFEGEPARPALPEPVRGIAAPVLRPADLAELAPNDVERQASVAVGERFPNGVISRCASALYLVNLYDWLELSGGWASIELLVRSLLSEEFDDDPLWALLAGLDHRAEGFEATDAQSSDEAAERVIRLLDEQQIELTALVRPGRIAVTATHVDVVQDLEAIDVGIRMAGLDRDPGWVPDLARIITFYFEGGGA